MIVSFRDKNTAAFYEGERVAAFAGFERTAERKLDQLDAATSVLDLSRPGNHLEKLKKDSFAYGLVSLEHRRWCCYMASIGWRSGERSDKFRRNPCLVTQQKLMETKPEMCKYDLMSLMARYKTDILNHSAIG